MGFSGIASSVIMFIAVLSIATGVVVVLKNYVSDTGNAVAIQQNIIKDQLRADISIDLISYDNVNTTIIYVKNTGKTQLSTTDLDVYIDSSRFPRNDTNRTITLMSDTDTTNTGNWDPEEIVMIQAFKTLGSASHEVIVKAEHKATAEEEFST